MVSIRCKMIVRAEMDKLGLHHCTVDLGEVDMPEDISAGDREKLKVALLLSGLELMDDPKSITISL